MLFVLTLAFDANDSSHLPRPSIIWMMSQRNIYAKSKAKKEGKNKNKKIQNQKKRDEELPRNKVNQSYSGSANTD